MSCSVPTGVTSSHHIPSMNMSNDLPKRKKIRDDEMPAGAQFRLNCRVIGYNESSNLGTKDLVQSQYDSQRSTQLNESIVALGYDAARSTQGALPISAFRPTPHLMDTMKDGTFTRVPPLSCLWSRM